MTRADKTAAWQGVEDDVHHTPWGSGSQSQGCQESPFFSGSQGPISP